MSMSRKEAEPTLMATPYWIIQKLGMSIGGFQYEQLRASLERLAAVAYQNTAFYNPVTQQHERVTLHFFSSYLPTRGRGADVDTNARGGSSGRRCSSRCAKPPGAHYSLISMFTGT